MYNNFLKFIRVIQGISHIYSGELKINGIYQIMSNRHYKLGFYLDRKKLRRCVNGYAIKHNVDFYAEFDPTDDNKVRVSISIAMEDQPNDHLTRPPTNSFIISKEGYVTQSGYGDFTMTITYYLFLLMVREIKDLILKVPKKLIVKPQQSNRVSTSVLSLISHDDVTFDTFVKACTWKPPCYGVSNDPEFSTNDKNNSNNIYNEHNEMGNEKSSDFSHDPFLSMNKRDLELDIHNKFDPDDGNNEDINLNLLNDIAY